ncbi:MAG TPA: hypothetical protein VFV67_31190 [Actinophytocola sp.]|uniref:hypothetical protein n=1 Tax=Actinophytocola sp. TaxID=1872138 RepID=UPI002DC020A2|nr:hypothetical protein [Actinophytocola sp.]HEU5475133.1 hypothetical protein [Actinophytocola sp.]
MRTRIAVTLAALVGVAGCSDDPPAARPEVPAFSTPVAAPSSVAAKAVPRTCGGVASLTEVTDILGAAVTGQTLPIVGVPEPKIGRTARIDCYYGVPDGAPVSAAVVQIGLASYTDRSAAQRRMTSTVETERETGAKASDVPVGADRGVLLNGAKRTLVAVRGNNTVVVTVNPDLIAEEQSGSLLGRLADRALTPR